MGVRRAPNVGYGFRVRKWYPKAPTRKALVLPFRRWHSCSSTVEGPRMGLRLFDARWRRHDHRGDVTRFVRQKDHRSRPCQLHAAYRAWTAACRMDIGPTCGVLLLGGLPSIQLTLGRPPKDRRQRGVERSDRPRDGGRAGVHFRMHARGTTDFALWQQAGPNKLPHLRGRACGCVCMHRGCVHACRF